MGGGDPTTMQGPITEPDQIAERVLPIGAVMLMTPPLMHVSAQWGAFSMLYGGSKVVLAAPGQFDPAEVLRLIETESVNVLTLVGDAMARPVLDVLAAQLDALRPVVVDRVRLGRRGAVGVDQGPSRRASPRCDHRRRVRLDRDRRHRHARPTSRRRCGTGDQVHASSDHTAVLDDDLRPVAPGSGAIGHLGSPRPRAARLLQGPGEVGRVDGGGRRCALGVDRRRGDRRRRRHGRAARPRLGEHQHRRREGVPRGGRGGGEGPPGVYDAVVVGAPDERWGERVVAVVALRPGRDPDARRVAATLPRLARRLQAAARAGLRRRTWNAGRTARPTTAGRASARGSALAGCEGERHAQARGRRQPVHLQREPARGTSTR